MDGNEKEFENFVRQIRFDDKPDLSHRDKLEQDLLAALAKQTRQKEQPLIIWKTIMKSKITKLAAAAAVIIIALLAVIQMSGVSIDASSVAFSQTIEATKKAPYVHIILEIRRSGSILAQEYWIGFEQGLLGQKRMDGTVSFYDLNRNKEFLYTPTSGTIIVSDHYVDSKRVEEEKINSAEKLLTGLLKDFGISEADMYVEQTQHNSVEVDIFRAMLEKNDSTTAKITGEAQFIVDHHTHLLLSAKVEARSDSNPEPVTMTLTYDYPETAPKDVYDLGVPKSIKIAEKTPGN